MSVQISLFEKKRDAKAAKVVERVKEVVGDGFDVERFVENFEVLAEAGGGVARLRQLALQFAFQGRYTGHGRPLIPAVVQGNHEALGITKGREATTTPVPGGAALAVGAAEMLIPEGWDWVPLVSVAKLESGHTPSRNHADYWDGGIPWIGIRDAKQHNFACIDSTEQTVSAKGLENSSARLLPAGTVCLSRTASVGYVTIMKRPMATSQDFVNWVCGPRIAPEYLMQLLRCEVPVLKRFSKGAVHQTIYFPEVKAFHISLPPLAEQKRIVAKVDQLMALCDDLEARQTKKREVGTRLTKSALEALTSAQGPEEFDAARNRVVENFDVIVDRAEKVGELRRAVVTLALRGRLVSRDASAAMVEQPIQGRSVAAKAKEIAFKVPPSELPGHWVWAPLGSLISDGPKNGYSPKGVEHETGVKSLTLTATTSGRFDGRYFKYIDEDIPTSSELWLEDGDILVQRGNTIEYVGVAAIYRGPPRTFIYPDLMMKFRISEQMDLHFVHMAINGPEARTFIVSKASGTSGSMPKINQATLLAIPIPIPPLKEQQRIVAKVDQLMKICDELEAKLRRAEDRASKLVEAVVQELVAGDCAP
jgi:type I restriction enzyme S subunit